MKETVSVDNINEKVTKLLSQISKAQKKIQCIQSICRHEKVEEKTGSNTGNYDPYADIYWIDYKCLICLKRWSKTKTLGSDWK